MAFRTRQLWNRWTGAAGRASLLAVILLGPMAGCGGTGVEADHRTLAERQLRQGNLDAAMDLIDEAVRRDPENPLNHRVRAAILQRARRYEELVSCLEEYARLKPIAEAHVGLALALDQVGRSSEALDQYRRGLMLYEQRLQADPGDRNARANLAFVLFLLGEEQRGRQMIRDQLSSQQDDQEALAIQKLMEQYTDRASFLQKVMGIPDGSATPPASPTP